jgi:sterol desaturase/sphingolipid hydroxylase (fatty acid hydroxylase superfamily)
MDTLNIIVFAVALTFGLAQHFLDRDHPALPHSATRWWTNGVLFVADTAVVTLFAAAIAWLTRVDTATVIAPSPITALPWTLQVAVMLMAHSFVQYWVHRAGHQIPLLWGWHRIHHTDTQLDATTGLRHHPFESMLDYLAFLLPVLLLAPSAAGVLGYFILSIAFAMFTHFPPHWLPAKWDRAISYVLMTPRLHQLHHSTWQPETDTNYGNVLNIWDRLFGTFLAPPPVPRAGFALGLEEFPVKKAQDPFLQLASPFLAADQREKA